MCPPKRKTDLRGWPHNGEGLKYGADSLICHLNETSSELSCTTITTSIFANFPSTFNPNKVAVDGHSLGGATAAITVQRDSRAIGGLNFDGIIQGPVQDQGFKNKPFVLVSEGIDPSDTGLSPNWATFYHYIDAPSLNVLVQKTLHYAFLDVPLLLTVYDLPPAYKPQVEKVIGTLGGRKVEKAINRIMVALLELLFENKTDALKNIARDCDIEKKRSNLPKGK